MALLPEAIRASNTETARTVTPEGIEVVVQRVIGKEEPDSEESYAVQAYIANGERLLAFDADDLVETIARLRAMGLPGFDPEAPVWQASVGPRDVDPTPIVHAP